MYEKIQKRYFAEIAEWCALPAPHHYVMLSGGVDSFMLLAAVMQTHKPDDVTALNIRGDNLAEYVKAKEAAAYYGVNMASCHIGASDYVSHVALLSGTGYKSVFTAMFHIGIELLFSAFPPIPQSRIYQGDGADTLYGNLNRYAYLNTAKIARKNGISHAEAREHLRREAKASAYAGKGSGTALLVRDCIRRHGCIPVQPFADKHFSYILAVPLHVFKADKKEWIKSGMVAHYGVDYAMAYSRKRIAMQDGTGCKKKFADAVIKITGKSSSGRAVAELSK